MTNRENERYSRQMMIPGWSKEHQNRLKTAHVGIIGVGGLGSPVALYLCAAGIGHLTLCDYQEVELSNLNRQILYTTDDIGRRKVEQAQTRLQALNPEILIDVVAELIDESNVYSLLNPCDLLIDCLDNIETRHVLNRFSWSHQIPLLHGGISEYYGQIYLSEPEKTPCLACLLPETFPDGNPVPVAGPVAGVIASLQAIEALKYLGGMAESESGVLRLVDLITMEIESIALKSRRNCPVCGRKGERV